VVTEVGNNIVHNIYKQRNNPLLFVTVENHIQEMSQNLQKERKIFIMHSQIAFYLLFSILSV